MKTTGKKVSSHHYGVTEEEKKSQTSIKSRQIVSEILDFGVTQEQILQIIKLLALNIENRDHMLSLVESVNSLIVEDHTDKIIT
tara:strand:- start:976 stop:1227 length:252 start_codon:yes stop_codon:yes gene_type:complete